MFFFFFDIYLYHEDCFVVKFEALYYTIHNHQGIVIGWSLIKEPAAGKIHRWLLPPENTQKRRVAEG